MRKVLRGVLGGEYGIEIVGEACKLGEMIEMRKQLVPDIRQNRGVLHENRASRPNVTRVIVELIPSLQ